MEAILPNGTTQMLSHVNNFNFNWHNNYVYADDVAPLLPKGTILKITSWYDNTTANKNNPDPNQWVGFGRSHRRRDGPRVGEHHLHERRGLSRPNSNGDEDAGHRAPRRCADRSSRTRMRACRSRRCSPASCSPRVGSLVAARSERAGQLPIEPVKESGQSVTGAFEGWYQNPDGIVHPARRLLQSKHEADVRHSGRARTTASSPAGRTWASPRTSCRAGNGACSRSSSRRTSARTS